MKKEILNKEESNILFSLTTLLFSLSRSFHQMNEIIPLRQGGELGTDKYWIATEEEAFFRKATKVTIACG
jgi:hypothetical protein